MLKRGGGSLDWFALVYLIIVLAIMGTVIWRAEMGEEVTVNVKNLGEVPVVANGTSR